MAIDVLEIYRAECDYCPAVHEECECDHQIAEDAIACAVRSGWAPIDDEPIGALCPDCNEGNNTAADRRDDPPACTP